MANVTVTPVYPQRFTAHLWNNIRSSRLRLHQVIVRQCHILLSSDVLEDEHSLLAQKAKSEANIIHFALEIAASVPQLGGYLKQVQYNLTSSDTTLSTPSSISVPGTLDQSCVPSQMSVLYAECNNGAIKVDAPAHVAPLIDGPQPASMYHMLFQLYSLRSIPILPLIFKKWIQERTQWMETHTEPGDLARLQEMVLKRPGDGFPVEDEG